MPAFPIGRVRALLPHIVAALLVAPACVGAQAGPVVRTTSVTTTVAGVFSATPLPLALTQTSQTGSLCSPGACYTAPLTVRGNRGWQLQVRLASQPTAYTVSSVSTSVPAGTQTVNSGTLTPLTTSAWVTVARGTAATSSTALTLQFNARRTNGKEGAVPNAAELAGVIAVQVVPYP